MDWWIPEPKGPKEAMIDRMEVTSQAAKLVAINLRFHGPTRWDVYLECQCRQAAWEISTGLG